MLTWFIILLVMRHAVNSRSTPALHKSVRQGKSCINLYIYICKYKYVNGLSAAKAKLTLKSSWKQQLMGVFCFVFYSWTALLVLVAFLPLTEVLNQHISAQVNLYWLILVYAAWGTGQALHILMWKTSFQNCTKTEFCLFSHNQQTGNTG